MTPSNVLMKEPILFDHDGSADDFLSLLLLLLMDRVDLIGISITPADCYPDNALETTLKLLMLTKRVDIPISVGQFYGINAFPAEWRAKPKILNALPTLINVPVNTNALYAGESKDFIVETLLTATQPVTLLLTGPCSNLVRALEENATIISNIKRIIWMGGAVDVAGNVRMYNHNGTAEWNVFWDPISAHKLVQMGLTLILIPLDVTNRVVVNLDFLKQLALHSEHLGANLAGQFWATTLDTIPAYEYTYFMWDVLATSYLAIPEIFELETLELDIVPQGSNAGQTYRRPGSNQWVQVARHVDEGVFYQYVLRQFGQSFPANSAERVFLSNE